MSNVNWCASGVTGLWGNLSPYSMVLEVKRNHTNEFTMPLIRVQYKLTLSLQRWCLFCQAISDTIHLQKGSKVIVSTPIIFRLWSTAHGSKGYDSMSQKEEGEALSPKGVRVRTKAHLVRQWSQQVCALQTGCLGPVINRGKLLNNNRLQFSHL
jgi:hypothetical protein